MQAVDPSEQLKTLAHRRDRAIKKRTALSRVEARYPWYRLGALIAGLLIAYLAFSLLPTIPASILTLAAFAFFLWITVLHRRIIDQIQHVETFQQLIETYIARIQIDWEHIPAPFPVPTALEHAFALDLNITGSRSLHQLLDTTVTTGGSQRLADWFLATRPDPNVIQQRQNLVNELINHPSFRLQIELRGHLIHTAKETRWDNRPLITWLESHRASGSLKPFLIALFLLAAANLLLFILNVAGILPPIWVVTFFAYFALQSLKYRESSEVFDQAYTLSGQLSRLRKVLAYLESYPYTPGEQLTERCTPFCQGTQKPSALLRKIGWIASAASVHNNPFLSLILNILVPWDLFFADQLETMKSQLRGVLPVWLDTWYEIEASNALANFAALNPETTFPRLLESPVSPVFKAAEVGHPLIPKSERVNNSYVIDRLGDVAIITGSNMSGKSTFLRTLGINLVLAFAGGPVCANTFQTIPFRLFTSMNLNDSLSDGISFFYAEVRRLKALLDQLETPEQAPSFFLIDEIFRGTNNRERQLGARAYAQALAGKHGVGMISTHDLELAHLADTIPVVQNYHFREEVKDGKMVFDFKIRPGASPTTNALRIMSLAGLPIPRDEIA